MKLSDGVISVPGMVELSEAVLALLDEDLPHSPELVQELLDVFDSAVWREVTEEHSGVVTTHSLQLWKDQMITW